MLFKELIFLWLGLLTVDEYTSKFHELSILSRVFKIE